MEDRYRDFPRPDHHFHDFDHRERGHYQEHVIDRSAPPLQLLPRVIRCGRWVLVLYEKLIASWDLHGTTAGIIQGTPDTLYLHGGSAALTAKAPHASQRTLVHPGPALTLYFPFPGVLSGLYSPPQAVCIPDNSPLPIVDTRQLSWVSGFMETVAACSVMAPTSREEPSIYQSHPCHCIPRREVLVKKGTQNLSPRETSASTPLPCVPISLLCSLCRRDGSRPGMEERDGQVSGSGHLWSLLGKEQQLSSIAPWLGT